jgi:hypothetical protein
MKKIQIFIALILVTIISSCSKDEPAETIAKPTNFEEIKLTDIQKRSSLMTATNILASNAVGFLWTKGTVIIFKTSDGTFGKLEVVNIEKVNNYLLILNITNFNSNGTIKNNIKGYVIRGTWGCNLDLTQEETVGLKSDFLWDRPTDFETFLVPKNGAVFLKYTF